MTAAARFEMWWNAVRVHLDQRLRDDPSLMLDASNAAIDDVPAEEYARRLAAQVTAWRKPARRRTT